MSLFPYKTLKYTQNINHINSHNIKEQYTFQNYITKLDKPLYEHIFEISHNLHILPTSIKSYSKNYYLVNTSHITNKSIEINIFDIIYFQNHQQQYYIFRGKHFANKCIFEPNLKLFETHETSGIYFTHPGIYFISSVNDCKNNHILTIIVT